MSISLAIKYRPTTFNDVTEQDSAKIILQQQISTNSHKNAYLFCGGAGTGKTTCARIFANELNKGQGNPIELDAASNNSVDDVREIIQQAKSKSLDSEYKVFIIDECHALSNSAWQAMLKLIEEPPAKSIFIFCTTDPQKIPKTIISRVQRYDFQRISQLGIVNRLHEICVSEEVAPVPAGDYDDALEYIAKIADGGMRDAITLLDKCLAYNKNLTLENVVAALGTADYDTMFELTDAILGSDPKQVISIIENIYNSGKDIKQWIKQYTQFVLDINKHQIGCDWKYITIPRLANYGSRVEGYDFDQCTSLLSTLINLNDDIKYSSAPKYDVEATLLLGII